MGGVDRPERLLCSPNGKIPDYPHGTLQPEEFRNLVLRRGAVMLRNAAEPNLLDQIKQEIDGMFVRYANVPAGDLRHPATDRDPTIKHDDIWNQVKRGHIYEPAFKQLAGLSYFDIIRGSGLWDFAARAFPECEVTESAVSSCRRTTVGDVPIFFDAPLDFHVDAQFHYIHELSINFWTPLTPCGKDSPGLEVVLLGVQQTRDYLEFNEAGYEPGPDDIAHMRHFRWNKARLDKLEQHGLAKCIWVPEFKKGDILAFTNFTMHATHCTPDMADPRTSVEVRVNLPGADITVLGMQDGEAIL
jgi:hypothetical protein